MRARFLGIVNISVKGREGERKKELLGGEGRMPSAEETTYHLISVPMPDGAQADAFLARDVDLLVSQIKENLRLSSLKAKSSISHKNSRPSPYRELLREGGLIKEAVKRLQANLDELSSSEVEEDEEVVVDDEDDERRTSGCYRRKPYFYDSEDEPLPPMYEPLELFGLVPDSCALNPKPYKDTVARTVSSENNKRYNKYTAATPQNYERDS
ncbi:hypothetical protein EAI_03695 [Harpegnathos saltator]|uniref:Uncharacterized protein n=1 Tax=Harpegnathos saltator TaxID=610380 RepID=E2BCC6_HARSA|nr:hypothetical protein EAI_03695 [Harpegnathos saltator]